ncbi:MAG: DUF1592 domain-containing protein [Sandaracinaceae bacterium]
MGRSKTTLGLMALGLIGSACTGAIDAARPLRPGGAVEPLRCPEVARPVAQPLVRLGRAELLEALEDLFGEATITLLADEVRALPADENAVEGGFDNGDVRLSQAHVDAFYGLADALATRVANEPGLRTSVVGACATDAVDDACLAGFVESFLAETARRAPTAEEVTRSLQAAAAFDGLDRVHAVVFTALMSPDFLYHVETGGAVGGDGTIALSADELANRLSFLLWGAPPDAELRRAAAAGALDDPAAYEAQVDRLFADPRAEARLIAFFDEWLHLERGPFVESPRLSVLAAGIDVRGLPDEMRGEVHDMLRFHLAMGDTWRDVLTSPYAFARTGRLAGLYGVPVWDGGAAPPAFPTGERSGVLGRAAMLYTSDGSTNPFRRGIFVRRELLCDEVDPPPADIPADALASPPVEAGVSSRQAFADKVRYEPCASCHAQFSDFGYALEAYDGLARFRTEETLVTSDGEQRGTAPVDPEAVPRVELDDERPIASPVELNDRLAASDKVDRCLAAHYFRFAFRRIEEGEDRCFVEDITRRIADGMSLRDAFRTVATHPTFRTRRLED